MEKAAIIQVFGRVQGVGFRYYTEKKATELQLRGFVENKADGSVYIEAEGQEENLEIFIAWCMKGPQWARVLNSTIQAAGPVGYTTFKIR
ncbi:MAG TPA: acylphosphatase [Bacteroidales bacterium]|nr:acylphosphatase [Bacteroidales bacterium]HQQ12693.1 acylphosphatase [Bacteroidales bacterium]